MEHDEGGPRDEDDGGFEDGGFEDGDFDEHDELLALARAILAERGPLSPEELAEELGASEEDVDELLEDPALVFVADGRLAFAHAIMGGATLTHRISRSESEAQIVELSTCLSPIESWTCDEEHLHLPGGTIVELCEGADDAVGLAFDDLGLPALGEGAVIGFTLSATVGELPTVEAVAMDESPVPTDALCEQLRRSFERVSPGDPMPVTPVQLVCQLLFDTSALASQPLPPLDELLEVAGFEVRGLYTAPLGADWEAFDQVQSSLQVAARRQLGMNETRALTLLVRAAQPPSGEPRSGRLSKDLATGLAHMLSDSELAEAFADAMRGDPGTARSFVRQLRQVSGHRHEAGLWWCESLVAGRAGDVEAAESCLQSAIVADPDCTPALSDAAWYASDRGDAAAAVRLLQRADDDDEERIALLRRFSAVIAPLPRVGRNDPCPCGSGRKYKQCCIARPLGATNLALGVRVRWLWEKMRWWLDRLGPSDDMLGVAFLLQGTWPHDQGTAGRRFAADVDLAASLLLFVDDRVGDFLTQRGGLLPVDEADLVSHWAHSGPSVHEVAGLRAGEGFSLRDLRTADVVGVRERRGSQSLQNGDFVFTHPVFDGTVHQIVGGIVPVTLSQRGPLMDLLDEEASAYAIADELARTRRAPQLVNVEGEPTVMCQGTYRLEDPDAARGRLDAVLERHGADDWAEMVERNGERFVRANATIDGETLTLFANSVARFERVKGTVTSALGSLEPLEETREPIGDAVSRLRRDGAGDRHEQPGPPPGADEALRELLRAREVAWLDEPVPALGGRTPRQAVDDPTRKEDLLALLHEYERSRVPEGAVGYDVSHLRQLLGLG